MCTCYNKNRTNHDNDAGVDVSHASSYPSFHEAQSTILYLHRPCSTQPTFQVSLSVTAQVSQSRIKQSAASSAVPLGRVCGVLGKFPAAGSVGGAEGGGGSDEVGVQERDPLVWNLGLHWKAQECQHLHFTSCLPLGMKI